MSDLGTFENRTPCGWRPGGSIIFDPVLFSGVCFLVVNFICFSKTKLSLSFFTFWTCMCYQSIQFVRFELFVGKDTIARVVLLCTKVFNRFELYIELHSTVNTDTQATTDNQTIFSLHIEEKSFFKFISACLLISLQNTIIVCNTFL